MSLVKKVRMFGERDIMASIDSEKEKKGSRKRWLYHSSQVKKAPSRNKANWFF